MANFKTHYQVGVGASIVGSTAVVLSGISDANPFFMWLLLFVVGTAGSIMPDIDSDNSRPIFIMSVIVNVLTAVMVAYAVYVQNSYLVYLQELIYQVVTHQLAAIVLTGLLVLGLALALVTYVLIPAFKRWTVHRGIFHSLVAAALFGVIFTAISWQFLRVTAQDAWIVGAFMSFGYMVHLSLDELYSVDFENQRIKRSFGTALKITDFKQIDRTVLFLMAIALVVVFLTPAAEYIDFSIHWKG